MYLFAAHGLETLGYRRCEWKCDALNAPSRRAALRFGFTREGHFRRAVIVRGRTRDTAWFAMIDEEWPALKAACEQWLAPENFDAKGWQRSRLSELTASAQSPPVQWNSPWAARRHPDRRAIAAAIRRRPRRREERRRLPPAASRAGAARKTTVSLPMCGMPLGPKP